MPESQYRFGISAKGLWEGTLVKKGERLSLISNF